MSNLIPGLAAAVLALLVSLAPPVPALDQGATGLQTFTLANGLEVFVLENHTVPLARVEITFRTGAISQTPSTAGLFHLYEHMMFKGNRVYPDQTALQAAMRDLGVADWNGGTSQESVSYYFTVPSDRVEKGIEFWADAVRFPLLNPSELQTEKDVVVNEIRANFSDPGNLYGSAIQRAMFWKYPWRKDVAGSEALVRAATVPVLRQIEATWYVPNNAALFVGGDVNPAAVRAAAQKYFGDWSRAADPWAVPPPAHPPLARSVRLVAADDQMYAGLASVDLRFRGPDVMHSVHSTYVADVLTKLLEDPNGRFRSAIFSKVPGQYNKDYISLDYLTRRDGGSVGFTSYLVLHRGGSETGDTFVRAQALQEAFLAEMKRIATEPDYFSPEEFSLLKRQIADERIWERETADGFVGTLSFWWSTAGTAYYLGYNDELAAVTPADIARFVSSTILSKPSILSVRMNLADYDREKSSAAARSWTLVTRTIAYWWADSQAGGSP